MSNIWTVVGIAILTVVFTLVLKGIKPEYALIVQIVGLAVIAVTSLSGIYLLKQRIEQIFNTDIINSEIITFCFKLMGICYISNFASNLCKDAGQTALAVKLETFGKILIVLMTLPLIESIVETVVELIG